MTWTFFAQGMAVAVGAASLYGLTPTAEAAAGAPARPFDFNGDGHAELVIGSPGGAVGGRAGAGFVSVVPGSRAGLDTRRRRVIHQDSAGVPGAAERGDRFGDAIASADFDRNGYADLAVGAPGEDSSGRSNAGSVTILWGSPGGLKRAVSYGEARTPGKGHRFGESLAVGDIQRDGSPELFVTVPGTSTFTWIYFAGARTSVAAAAPGPARPASARDVTDSWVASGDVNGDGRGDVAYAWYDFDGGRVDERRGFTVFHGTADGRFTRGRTVHTPVHSLAVADFNGDRRADVAVGSAFDGPTGGQVTVYPGAPFTGLGRGYSISQASPGVPNDPLVEDCFGAALAAGDVNGDGRADLAVGAPKAEVGRIPDAGRAYLLYGSPRGLTGRGSQSLSQNTKGVPGGAEPYDGFGEQVALLDHTRDGRADLTVGAPAEDSGNGSVVFVRGTAAGLSTAGSTAVTASSLGVRDRDARLGGRLGRTG
ncbi:MAG TPA: FG-GAP-like repeat-containing protein [Thermomonospora sp.]|nr:FG-GAP-like repeat-containing protein [Thermomonospora sp.]